MALARYFLKGLVFSRLIPQAGIAAEGNQSLVEKIDGLLNWGVETDLYILSCCLFSSEGENPSILAIAMDLSTREGAQYH